VPLGKHLAQVVKETERKIGRVRSVLPKNRSSRHSCVNPKSAALELDAGRDKPLLEYSVEP
jgi:hypothetical protein